MPPSTTFDEPPEFDVGDRVVTVDPVGPRWRRVPRGSAGIVVARTAQRLVAVHFDSGGVEHVHPTSLAYEQPGADPKPGTMTAAGRTLPVPVCTATSLRVTGSSARPRNAASAAATA